MTLAAPSGSEAKLEQETTTRGHSFAQRMFESLLSGRIWHIMWGNGNDEYQI